MAQSIPILPVYHTVEGNKQLLQSMSVSRLKFRKKGLVNAMQSNGPQTKFINK